MKKQISLEAPKNVRCSECKKQTPVCCYGSWSGEPLASARQEAAPTPETPQWVKAARKQRTGLRDGTFAHALICNYAVPTARFCNCGVADLQRALEAWEAAAVPLPSPRAQNEQEARVHAVIAQWREKGNAEMVESLDRDMGAAAGVAAMRLHCADELEAALTASDRLCSETAAAREGNE